MSMLLECFAIVAPGLEALALAEARELGLPAELQAGGGGIAWRGDLRSVLVANVGLRIASRVVVRLATFEARSFAELERHARQIPWASVVMPREAVRFRVTCKKSKLYHSDAVAQRLADAVTRAIPGVRAEGASGSDDDTPSVDDAQLFVVRMLRDECTVSADTSGALLHRRGYRQATAKAPLRETVAAALLAASGWDRVAPLVDPLCGSGTIPIEAALLARRVPPGLRRGFALEKWPLFDPADLRAAVARAEDRILPRAPVPIVGADRDAGAIEAATGNATRAGVPEDIVFRRAAISALEPPAGPGVVVTNPPYGVRVGRSRDLRDLYARLGQVLRRRCPGWSVALLSARAELAAQTGLDLSTALSTTNGGIRVRLLTGSVPATA